MPGITLDPELYRHYLQAYTIYLQIVDVQIGEILQTLESSGKADNIIVVFSADHGESLGTFGLVNKQVNFYENIVYIPLAIRIPGQPVGIDRGRLVSNLDYFPTLCDLAGMAAPTGLRGTSLLRLDKREFVVSKWHFEYFFTVSSGRMILDGRYQYTHYLEGGGEELYDRDSDNGEMRNLAPLPESKPLLELFRARLCRHVVDTDDPYFSLPVFADPRYRSHPVGSQSHNGLNDVKEGRQLFWSVLCSICRFISRQPRPEENTPCREQSKTENSLPRSHSCLCSRSLRRRKERAAHRGEFGRWQKCCACAGEME